MTQIDAMNINDRIANFWKKWLKKSPIKSDKFISIDYVSTQLQLVTWWSIYPTNQQVIASTLERCYHQSNKRLLTSWFLRNINQLENCPEPDQWHDIIGHIVPLFNQEYADVYQFLGTSRLKAYDSNNILQQELIVKIIQYVFESGVIYEEWIYRSLWATIYSSSGEFRDTFLSIRNYTPLSVQALKRVPAYNRALTFHPIVFVIWSFEEIYQIVHEIVNIN